jgi:hypothetical protein
LQSSESWQKDGTLALTQLKGEFVKGSLKDQAYQHIRQKMMDGELQLGSRIEEPGVRGKGQFIRPLLSSSYWS